MTLDDLSKRPLSYSSIKEFARSPRHYINYLKKARKDTPELIFGGALHCILLTPNLFKEQYVQSQKFDLRKKDDKEEYAKLLTSAESKGQKIIQEDVFDELINLTDFVKSNPEFQQIMFDAKSVEQREYMELYGLPFVKIKDIETSYATIDIKTVQSGALENLNKDFFNYQYYIQAAIYGGNFKFYVIEKNDPYYNGLIDVSQDWMDYGLAKLETLCKAFNYCLEHPESFNESYGFWYKYNDKKPIISLPNWAK